MIITAEGKLDKDVIMDEICECLSDIEAMVESEDEFEHLAAIAKRTRNLIWTAITVCPGIWNKVQLLVPYVMCEYHYLDCTIRYIQEKRSGS